MLLPSSALTDEVTVASIRRGGAGVVRGAAQSRQVAAEVSRRMVRTGEGETRLVEVTLLARPGADWTPGDEVTYRGRALTIFAVDEVGGAGRLSHYEIQCG